MLRLLQFAMLTLGNTVLFGTTLAIALAYLGEATIFRRSPTVHGTGAWGAYYGFVACFLLGGFIGTITGFSVSVATIYRNERKPWKLPTWIGLIIGLCTGLVIRFDIAVSERSGILNDLVLRYSLATGLLLTLTATLGGYAGCLVEIIQSSRRTRH